MDPIVDRGLLFGNPERAQARVSPDGRWVSFLAPVDGVMNVWVGPATDPGSAAPVTHDTGRGIQMHDWACSGERLLYVQDLEGDENWHLFAVDPDSREVLDLTPLPGVSAQLHLVSPRRPHEVLVGLNDRVPELHDPTVIDVRTGERTRLVENPGFARIVCDGDYRPRLAVQLLPDSSLHVHRLQPDGSWVVTDEVDAEDQLNTVPLLFDSTGQVLYWLDSRGRDTSALVAEDTATGARTVLAEDPRADIADLMVHPVTGACQAAMSTYDRVQTHVIDPAIAGHIEFLQGHRRGEMQVTSRSLDDAWWVVHWEQDDGPDTTALYDTRSGRVTTLFVAKPKLAEVPLARCHAEVVRSRDGLDLVSYLTLPRWLDHDGRPSQPLPTVLMVHGGPWHRDAWGFDPMVQLLANRGYAVLCVNFRGSTGFGKAFVNAGDNEWAGRMHDDLLDAVAWAVEQGITNPDRVAIMGGSYGGYATLVGLTFTPEQFTCGVDIVGPSNLVTLLETIPPYWAPMIATFHRRVGNASTDEGRAALWARSPLSKVDRIVRPLLIAQGANDPRVKQAESDQIVQAMRERDIDVEYALFPDEGHGFVRPENRIAFMAVAEHFLARHLGGRAQPLGDALAGSSIQRSGGAEAG